MQSAMVEKAFCTTREAASLLGVSVGTVQLWVESEVLDAWKTSGGHRRVMRDSVDRLLRKIPPTPHAPENLPPASQAAPTERPLKVLVVEDDAHLLRLYETRIKRWPLAVHVMCADNAFTALLMIGRTSPDLLITDLHMPGMDGFGMLRVLSVAPEVANTTIVVVSGLDANAIANQGGIPAGIQVLPKPIPFERLESIAHDLAERRRRAPLPPPSES